MKKRIIRYGIALFISFVLVLGILMLRSGARAMAGGMTDLCDAAFSVGVIFLSLGLLLFMSNLGAFDILAYGTASFLNLFRKRTDDQRFVDYLEYREAKRANSLRWGYLAVIGIIYIAMAGVLLMLC